MAVIGARGGDDADAALAARFALLGSGLIHWERLLGELITREV
jgi:hypothetical protein